MTEWAAEVASAGKYGTGDLAGKIQQSHLAQTETHILHLLPYILHFVKSKKISAQKKSAFAKTARTLADREIFPCVPPLGTPFPGAAAVTRRLLNGLLQTCRFCRYRFFCRSIQYHIILIFQEKIPQYIVFL